MRNVRLIFAADISFRSPEVSSKVSDFRVIFDFVGIIADHFYPRTAFEPYFDGIISPMRHTACNIFVLTDFINNVFLSIFYCTLTQLQSQRAR